MTRSFLSVLLVLTLWALTACVTPIEYELVDNAGNGYSISGTITTDGTMGYLTADNILEWEYTVTGPSSWSASSQSTPSTKKSIIDPVLIEADQTDIVMSGVGAIMLVPSIYSPVYVPQYRYENGGTVGFEPENGISVWNTVGNAKKVVFAIRPPPSVP